MLVKSVFHQFVTHPHKATHGTHSHCAHRYRLCCSLSSVAVPLTTAELHWPLANSESQYTHP